MTFNQKRSKLGAQQFQRQADNLNNCQQQMLGTIFNCLICSALEETLQLVTQQLHATFSNWGL